MHDFSHHFEQPDDPWLGIQMHILSLLQVPDLCPVNRQCERQSSWSSHITGRLLELKLSILG